MSTPFETQYYPEPPRGGALTANSIDASHIINGSITAADIADGAITDAKLAKIKAILIIHNSATSTVNLSYGISLRDNGNSVAYFTNPAQGILPGSTHSLLLNLSSSATVVELQVDSDGISVTQHEVYSGGTQTAWQDDMLSFTRDAGANNIQIAFELSDN
jgi:hypothetical protein